MFSILHICARVSLLQCKVLSQNLSCLTELNLDRLCLESEIKSLSMSVLDWKWEREYELHFVDAEEYGTFKNRIREVEFYLVFSNPF